MVKKKETENVEHLTQKQQDKLIENAFDVLDEHSTHSCFLKDNTLSNVESFEDTGCYILNALLSAKLVDGGWPAGRVGLIAAPSSIGKSYIVLKTAGIAQKKGKKIVIFDSENAIDSKFAESLGLDTTKCKYFPVESIEQCRNAIFSFLKFIGDNKLDGKFLIIIDSLANMVSEMEMTRLEKGKTSADMGTIAKAIKSLLKTATSLGGLTRTTILCTNHIYDNPSEMYPDMVKNMNGGKACRYLPSVVVQMDACKVKEGDEKRKIEGESSVGSKGFIGIEIKALSVKNRFVKPFQEAKMFLSWENGLNKYHGLLDLCLDAGLIVNNRGKYRLEDDTYIGVKADFEQDQKFWDKMLPKLQSFIDKEWTYSRNDEEIIKKEEALSLDVYNDD